MNDYDAQAQAFLDKHQIVFDAKMSNTKSPRWCGPGDHGYHYIVTLTNMEGRRLRFDWWDSIRNRWDGVEVARPYDVLTSVSCWSACPDTYEDFCAEFGYEPSAKVRSSFNACHKFASQIQAFFTEEQLNDVREII